LALVAGFLGLFSAVLAQDETPVLPPPAPAPSAPDWPQSPLPADQAQPPATAPSQDDRAAAKDLSEDDEAAADYSEYQLVPDDPWNQGPWESDVAQPGAASRPSAEEPWASRPSAEEQMFSSRSAEDWWLNRPSAEDQWWALRPSEKMPPEGQGRMFVQRDYDPGAIPGPEVGLEPPGKPDQFSGQAWGYIGDDQGAAPPVSRHPGRYAYGPDTWSDTRRYDNEQAFRQWWDSSLAGQPR
jgi:hypothetical protein